ncbi:hypothetical protein SLEP1_g12596 [Rubroshorea leprosula]|uniref:Uncharacterized protein n=1 Tax=Rubroshorea leprosula TaxID=152421 RepID=A0AAV5ILS3_9ROSI|nr:hypothetical protein SLEP1_g12596 [Rubroshorea leprosula]
MNSPAREDDHQGEVFLDEPDIIHEVTVNEEDLPDVKDEEYSDSENMGVEEEADDSMHIFTSHTGKFLTFFLRKRKV